LGRGWGSWWRDDEYDVENIVPASDQVDRLQHAPEHVARHTRIRRMLSWQTVGVNDDAEYIMCEDLLSTYV
jgi:hypothetical protein